MSAIKKKSDQSTKDKIDAERGKGMAQSVTDIRSTKTPGAIKLPTQAPVIRIQKKDVRKEAPAADPQDSHNKGGGREEQTELFDSDEEPGNIPTLGNSRKGNILIPSIFKIARGHPLIFPIKTRVGDKTFRAANFEELEFWKIPASQYQDLFDKFMEAAVAADVTAALAKRTKKQEAEDGATATGDGRKGTPEGDSLEPSPQDSPNKGGKSPRDIIPGAIMPAITILTEREAWATNERLSKKRFHSEMQHCKPGSTSGLALLSLDEIFQFVVGNQIRMLLQTAGGIEATLAIQRRITYANDQINWIKTIIRLI